MAPQLAAAYDTGASAEDGITNKNIVQIIGKAEPGSTIKLYLYDAEKSKMTGNNEVKGEALATAVTAADGTYTLTTSTLADGTYSLSVTATDVAGNVGTPTSPSSFTIDTVAPAAPGALTLSPGTDTGVSHTDGLTNDATPVITGTTEANATVTLFDADKMVGKATADGQGNFVITSSVLAEGAHVLTAKATDAAGNVSAASAVLNIVVETAAPAATSTPDADNAIFGSVLFDLHLSEPVTGVTLSALQVLGTGTATGEVTQIKGSGSDYTVLVDGLSGAGTLRLGLAAGNQVTDAAGNAAQITTSNYYQYTDQNTPFSVRVGTYSASGTSGVIGLSGGGRLVSFDTDVAETANDTNPNSDVHVEDVRTGGITLISAGVDGSVHNGTSGFSSLSANGNVIAFVSTATGLVADGPTDGLPNVYVAQLSTSNPAAGQAVSITDIKLVSAGNDQDGLPPALPDDSFYSGVGNYGAPMVSADGMHVVFASTQALIAGVTPGISNIYEYNIATDDLTLISGGPDNTGGNVGGDHPTVSGDGTMITYESGNNVYLVNVTANTTTLLNGAGLLNLNGNGLGVVSYGAQINSLGTWVTYTIQVGNSTSVVVNQNVAGANANAGKLEELTPYTLFSFDNSPTVSMGGRYVAYELNAFGINNANPPDQVAITDSLTNSTVDIGPGTGPVLSSDGNAIAYDNESYSTSDGVTTDTGGQIVLTTLGPTVGIDPVGSASELDAAEWNEALASGLVITGVTDAGTGSTVRLQLLNSSTSAVLATGQATVNGENVWSITLPVAGLATLADGTYKLTAIASATNGASFPSNRFIILDTQAPGTPDAPKLDAGSDTSTANDGSETSQAMPVFIGTAEAGATVSLYDNLSTTPASPIGTAIADSDGDYAITPDADLINAKHVFTVTATDAAGNVSDVSAGDTVTVDTIAPALPRPPILQPASSDLGDFAGSSLIDDPSAPAVVSSDTGISDTDDITKNASPTVTGMAEANTTVTLYDTDGIAVLGTAKVDGTGKYTISSSYLSDGVHNLTVTDTDDAGNVSTASNPLVVTIDTLPPAIPTITSVTGPLVSGKITSVVTVNGTAEPGSKVQLVLDGGMTAASIFGESTAASDGDYSINSDPLPAGDGQNLSVMATDIAGNVGQPSLPVDVDITDTATPPPGVPVFTPTLLGLLTDGPIAGATVFADSNANGIRDADEGSAITDADGTFQLVNTGGELIATGGIDSSTGLANLVALTAPAGSEQINPLTTLLDYYQQTTGTSLATAQASVTAALGLAGNGGTDITQLDPLTAAVSGSAALDPAIADGAPLIASAKIMDTAIDFANVLVGDVVAATNSVTAAIDADIKQYFGSVIGAMAILTQQDGTLNLDDQATLNTILTKAASQLGITAAFDAQAANAPTAVAIVAAENGNLDALAGGATLPAAVAEVEAVAQGAAAAALQALPNDTAATVANLQTQYTGQALYTATSASLSLLGQGPQLSPTSDTGESNQDNTTTDLNPTIIGMAKPGTYVTIFEYKLSYPPGSFYPVSSTVVIGTGIADVTGHYSIAVTSLAADTVAGPFVVGAVASATDPNVTLGDLITVPTDAPTLTIFPDDAVTYGASIEAATPAAAPGDDSGHSALLVYGRAAEGTGAESGIAGAINIYADGGTTPIATGLLSGDYAFALTTTPLSIGQHALTVTETLPGGTVTTNPAFNVTVTAASFVSGTASATGAIAGATVYQYDASPDQSSVSTLDITQDAVTSITAATGAYTDTFNTGSEAALTLRGGYDTLTGVPLGGYVAQAANFGSTYPASLLAPYNFAVITPFSTLLELMDEDDQIPGGATPADNGGNEASVLAAFGLPTNLDLATLNPVALAQAGDTAPLLMTAKLLDMVTIFSGLLGSNATVASFSFAPIADYLETVPSIDLDSATDIETIYSAFLAESPAYNQSYENGAALAKDLPAIAAIVAAGNQAIDAHAAAATSIADLLSYTLAAETFAQETETAAVAKAVPQDPGDGSSLAALTPAYTGTALAAGIEAARARATQATNFVPAGAATTASPSIDFTINFSQPVTNLAAANFSIVAGGDLTGLAITAVTAVAGSGNTQYDVSVDTGVGQGTLALTFNGTGLTSAAGKPITDGLFAPAVTTLGLLSVNSNPLGAIAVGDFNGDGRPDAVLTGNGQFGLALYINNGDGSFTAQAPITGALYGYDVVVGDFNGDGKLDMAEIGSANTDGNSTLAIMLGNGNGTFQPAIDSSVTPGELAVGDFNGDGRADLAITDFNTDTVSILLGNGDGTFSPGQNLTTTSPTSEIETADLNGDGKLDLVMSNLGANTVSVFLGNGDGSFTAAPTPTLTVGSDPQGIAIGDLNGDGIPDIAVANYGSNSVTVLLGKGDGSFTALAPFVLANAGVASTFLTNFQPGSIAISDLNNDGKPDLVLASGGGTVVLNGNGDGTFTLGQQTSNGTAGVDVGQALALADIDGDGRTDILEPGDVAQPGIAAGTNGLNVLQNEAPPVLGSTSAAVTIDRPSVAEPVIAKSSGAGTLTHTGNAYTLDLGTLTQGETAATVFALVNAALAPADSFDGLFSTPDGSGFTIKGDTLPDAVAAGASYAGLNFTADTSSPGSHSETITFAPRDATAVAASTTTVDDNDVPVVTQAATDPDAVALELPVLTLTVIDDVQAGTAPVLPAALRISSTAFVLPNTRIGATDQQPVTITNSAAAGSAALDVTATATGKATISGSIASLAPQASDTTSLVVGLETDAAGAGSGTVILTPVSEPNTPLANQTLDISGSVYREAAASVAAISEIVHVGDAGSVALAVKNTDPADGFSEKLDASIGSATSGLSITAAVPAIIAAGATNSSLDIGFSTATAGTVTGTATLALATDGGTGAGSLDGLGTLALASDPVAVSITVDNYAVASLSEVSGGGTLVKSGNNYMLDLGTIEQNATDPTIDIAALNAAMGAADTLSGNFQLTGSSSFTKTGFDDFSGVAAGTSADAGTVTLDTGTAGSYSETITFNPTGSNTSGYSGALPSETLTISAVVQAEQTTEPPAVAQIDSTVPIAFGNVHLGASASQKLSISNIASAPAASLDAFVGSVSGNAVASGTIDKLAAGDTDATDISVGIDTSAAGMRSGEVNLDLLSDSNGTMPLPNQSVSVSGAVYRVAAAAITPFIETVHVGDLGAAMLTVSNTDPDDGYSENLIASLAGVTGQISTRAAGPTGEIAAGSADASTLAVSFSTAAAGVINGTANVALASDGGTGSSSIDGLGKTALSTVAVPVAIMVDNLAQASLTSQGGTLTQGSTANTWTLDLGTTAMGSAPLSASLSVFNAAGGPADLLGGSFTVEGTPSFSNSGFGNFGGLAAGGSTNAGSVSLAATQTGTYTETVLLRPTDTEGSLAPVAQTTQTVTITGTITPQMGTAQGDVHIVTFDGLHYDFQATGDFVLARATDPENTFQIQIRAAEYLQSPGTSVTTEVAAQVGNDVVSFNLNQPSTVSIKGIADTAINAPGVQQILDGGTLVALSSTTYELKWETGETLDVTNNGNYLNETAVLSPQDGLGSVQGLLGSDSGQSNDFALPDGTVLPQPVPSATLLGTFANAWRVAPTASLLNTAPAETAVARSTGSAFFASMQFLNPQTNDRIAAAGDGQILTGSALIGVLNQGALPGITFRGTLETFGSDIVTNFGARDFIDISDFKGGSATALKLNAATDVLHIGYERQSANISFAGASPGASFWATSDGRGGTLIGTII